MRTCSTCRARMPKVEGVGISALRFSTSRYRNAALVRTIAISNNAEYFGGLLWRALQAVWKTVRAEFLVLDHRQHQPYANLGIFVARCGLAIQLQQECAEFFTDWGYIAHTRFHHADRKNVKNTLKYRLKELMIVNWISHRLMMVYILGPSFFFIL